MGDSGMIEQRVYTDEEIAENPSLYVDEDGVHLILEGGTALVQPSESYKARQKELEDNPSIPEPTDMEILQEDIAMLGEAVSISLENSDMVAEELGHSMIDSVFLAETLAMVLDELQSVKEELYILKGGVE